MPAAEGRSSVGPLKSPTPTANPPPPPAPFPPWEQKRAERAAEEARANTLTEWRHLDLRPLERAFRRGDKPLGDVLPKVLAKVRIEQRLSESQIVEVWKRTIDPVLTAHARPVSLAKGTLFVSVDSSPWLSEIVRYRQREILEKMQLAVGRDVVKKISFRIG